MLARWPMAFMHPTMWVTVIHTKETKLLSSSVFMIIRMREATCVSRSQALKASKRKLCAGKAGWNITKRSGCPSACGTWRQMARRSASPLGSMTITTSPREAIW